MLSLYFILRYSILGLDSVLSIGDKVYVGDIVNTGPR